jgi:hypothetical protein
LPQLAAFTVETLEQQRGAVIHLTGRVVWNEARSADERFLSARPKGPTKKPRLIPAFFKGAGLVL